MQHRKAIVDIVVAATILIPLVALTQQVGAQNSSFTTYTNPDFGYTIGYPSDWNIQRFPPTAPTAIYLTPPDKSQKVLIFADNSGNMTFQDMLKKDPQGNITGVRTIQWPIR